MITSKYQNLYPNCVFMKLQGEIITENRTETELSASTEKIKLKPTILFGQQYLKIGKTIVLFGIKSAELRLDCNNSILLLETLGLTPSFSQILEIEIVKEKGTNQELGGLIGFKTGIDGKITKNYKSSKKQKQEICQVYAKGATPDKTIEVSPCWVFQVKSKQPTLLGLLKKKQLGIFRINAKPCRIEATFNLKYKSDIHIFELRANENNINLSSQRVMEIVTQKSIYERNTGSLSFAEVSYE
ncbi:hypothetical protein CwatDRAFT_4676 [Crocosphaera watsonii WH 8501]|uniref:Uncharacterized protein n=3 Tax=Crocosphaera watsonii TaxID=263511 RepID=Q4C6A6_CROWT|nr:hypothetical protein CwatDRAFT_4676 [Crocosphaera watsonii WH 8501]